MSGRSHACSECKVEHAGDEADFAVCRQPREDWEIPNGEARPHVLGRELAGTDSADVALDDKRRPAGRPMRRGGLLRAVDPAGGLGGHRAVQAYPPASRGVSVIGCRGVAVGDRGGLAEWAQHGADKRVEWRKLAERGGRPAENLLEGSRLRAAQAVLTCLVQSLEEAPAILPCRGVEQMLRRADDHVERPSGQVGNEYEVVSLRVPQVRLAAGVTRKPSRHRVADLPRPRPLACSQPSLRLVEILGPGQVVSHLVRPEVPCEQLPDCVPEDCLNRRLLHHDPERSDTVV